MPAPRSLPDRVRGLRLPIRTRRLELVLPTAEHVPALVALLKDPEVERWTLAIPRHYTAADAIAHVRRARRRFGKGEAVLLQIRRRADGVLVGGIGFYDLDPKGRRGEVGYWLGRAYRGAGYATEAVGAMVRVGFRDLGLHRIEAGVMPGNRASARVLRRAGFHREGVLRDYVQKRGRWISSVLYSRLESDRQTRPP